MSVWSTATKSKAWKYVVLVFSAVSLALSIGFTHGFAGSLTLAVSQQFNLSITESSLPATFNTGFAQMSTTVAAVLTKVLPLRTLQLLGGLVIASGVCISSLATSNLELMLTYGVYTAIGVSLVRSAASGIVRQHFSNDQINVALCAMMCGSYIGIASTPATANYLFTNFTFQQTFLFLSPAFCINILSAIIFTDKSHKDKTVPSKKGHKVKASVWKDVKEVLADSKVWCFALSGGLKKFGMAGFYALIPHYVISERQLTLENTSVGGSIYGIAAIFGVFLMIALSLVEFNRVLPHALPPIVGGSAIACITAAESEVTYYIMMGVFGLTHGIVMANMMTVANKLGGAKNMLIVFAVEQFLQAFASFGGAPITSCIQDIFGLNVGVYITAGAIISSGLVSFIIMIIEYEENKVKQENNSKLAEEEKINLIVSDELDSG